MVSIIAGTKGKGKTKILLDQANAAIKDAKGSVVYLDKSTKHMYELNNKVRLINVLDYPVSSTEGFLGFISGIVAQDHDLEYMFLDSFLKLANLEGEDIAATVATIAKIGAANDVKIILSISMDKADLPESIKEYATNEL